MYRLLIIIGVLVYSSNSLFAQRVVFEETFVDNRLKWAVNKDSQHALEIKDGWAYLQHFRDVGYWCIWKDFFVDITKDFRISTKIKATHQSGNYEYGLIWGSKNAQNTHTFSINNKEEFNIGYYKNDQYYSMVEQPQKSLAIRTYGKVNELSLEKKRDSLYYYINKELVASTLFRGVFGYKIGVIAYQKTAIAVDEIIVDQNDKINLVENALKDWEKTNVGTNINSPYKELEPIVSHDGQWLYVARANHPDNIGEYNRSDAWVAKLGKDGTWQAIQNMAAPINNKGYNDVISISPDNNTLLISNTYNSDGSPGGKGISISHRTATGWELPQKVEIENFYNNDPYHSFCLAPNKKALLMAVDRDEGYGDLDIYVSFERDGKFTKPLNLGNTINTLGRDGTPFLAADGKTLYFSSSGHPGYGSADIFIAHRLDDSWTNWSTPQNLGPQVNTKDWDAYYSITADGEAAYMVSYGGDSKGESDIYKLSPPDEAKPEQVWKINGIVYNSKTKEKIAANIFYYDKTLQKELGRASTAPQDGFYQLIIPAQQDYQIYAFQKGYYPNYAYIDHQEFKSKTTITQDLYLHPIEKGETIPIQNDTTNLNRLRRLLETYPAMKIAINGNKEDIAKIQRFLQEQDIHQNRINKKGTNSKEPSFTIKELGEETQHNKEEDFDSNLNVNELVVGQKFRLSKLYFKADSAEITQQAVFSLMDLYKFLAKNQQIAIEIGGHTNGLPNHEYCDQLSSNRAKSVEQFLIQKGIDRKRLSTKGYGKRQPIATNETEQGRQRNQRVEVKILKLE